MNSNAKSPVLFRIKCALFAGFASLGMAACSPPPVDPPLANAPIGGAFELTAATGERVSWEDFRGSYAIVYFGYAYCPDVCPTDMQRTAQGLRILEERNPDLAGKIKAVFISIDPERDTPEVVGEFASAFSDDLIGLTGTPDEVKAAADKFAVYYKRGEETSEGGYLVDHTNIVYFFDPAGNPVTMLPTRDGAEAVADEIEKWAS